MELVLTGSPISAIEMERFGIVNKVVTDDEDVVEEALRIAQKIAAFSAPAAGLGKQAVKVGKSSWHMPHAPPPGEQIPRLTSKS
jgi:enoyl-CoA hydratase